MKKLLLLLPTIMMMAACDVEHYKETRINSDYSVRVIDSCEYIVLNGVGVKAHKGNCRFCEERDSIKWEKRRKELEELVIKLNEK